MKTRKTNTTTKPPRKYKPAVLITALAALTLMAPDPAEARTGGGLESASPVTVIGDQQIRQTGLQSAGDLLRAQPGFTTEGYGTGRFGNGTANVNLRGLGETPTLINGRRNTGIMHVPTGLFVDPAQVNRINTYDLERVEVLRGPQGTLFGRNANGGAINVVTRNNPNSFGRTTVDTNAYDLGADVGYKYNDLKFNPNLNYDPNTLGTGRINTGLSYDQPETEYAPDLTTAGAGMNTTLSTHTTPATTPCPKTGNQTATTQPTDTTAGTNTTAANPATDTHNPVARETGDATGVFNQPAVNYGYGSPCDKFRIDWDAVRNQQAQDSRQDAAWTAAGLMYDSQPQPFFDYNDYNTMNDELANRDYLSGQLSQSLTLANDNNLSLAAAYNDCHRPDPVTENKPYVPEYYYRVAGGGDYELINNDETTTAKTELPPVPKYNTTVDPINTKEMSDRQLQSEIKYGPSLIEGYQREAKELRDDAKEYRDWAKKRREGAARARTNAEDARKKAKNAKRASSREFWEEQAEAYDAHAEILEDSAELNDHSAKNADAAAERYEQDAQQTAENTAQALNEFTHRQGQAAAKAAQAQAAREAEAARLEAQRQRELDELLRRSQQSTQNNNTSNQGNRSTGPKREYRPDGRVPRPGKESRNETLRKLLD